MHELARDRTGERVVGRGEVGAGGAVGIGGAGRVGRHQREGRAEALAPGADQVGGDLGEERIGRLDRFPQCGVDPQQVVGQRREVGGQFGGAGRPQRCSRPGHAPRAVTRATAGRAMVLAPLVGVLLGLLASLVPWLVGVLAPQRRTTSLADLVTAVLAVGALALLTRGLHLDGLADTADGLGVKGVDSGVVERRLAVMRAPDVGAFGAVTLVLVVLAQVVALAACTAAGLGVMALVLATTTGRLGATWCCTVGVPSARPEGLGATVAGSVPRAAAAAATVAVLAGAVLLGRLGAEDGVRRSLVLVVAVLAGLAAGALLLHRCVTRLGGITGDVLGAVVELTTTAVLLALALATAGSSPAL